VQATDFRRAIERALRIGTYGSYFTGIVGADRCSKRKCELSGGIVADDRAGTITFHLRSPDPEFLYKLALPAAAPAPRGTPAGRSLPLGVAGTGPYLIESYEHSKLVLVRNPQFRQWSAAAQPDGYPDRIVWRFTADLDAQVTAVEHGAADLMFSPPSSRQQELAIHYAAQVHSFPTLATFSLFLNTRVPPFDSLQARRAVNYAIDRGAVIAAGFEGSVTCQILPAGMPGYRPYCPYTRDPTSGGPWTGPDLARARSLVASSGTSGDRVVVWTSDRPLPAEIAKLGVAALNRIGYRASVKVIPSADYFTEVNDSRNRAQAGFLGWFQDYPAASEFLGQLLCSSFAPATAENGNQAELCDQRFDRSFGRALSGQVADISAGTSSAWSGVDRLATDLSPWVPIFNPRNVVLVSRRVGNVQSNPQWGLLLDQMWVK
jgi:peptide/nickel transport system substrate-binding protein